MKPTSTWQVLQPYEGGMAPCRGVLGLGKHLGEDSIWAGGKGTEEKHIFITTATEAGLESLTNCFWFIPGRENRAKCIL